MAKFLTQEWLDLQKKLGQEFPERPGATARMQYKITGGPDGDVVFYTAIENGKILENVLGEDPEAEFTMTVGYDARFSSGHFGVWVATPPEKANEAEAVLRKHGAEVRRER